MVEVALVRDYKGLLRKHRECAEAARAVSLVAKRDRKRLRRAKDAHMAAKNRLGFAEAARGREPCQQLPVLASTFFLNSLRACVLCFVPSFLVLVANSRMRFALRLRIAARWSV